MKKKIFALAKKHGALITDYKTYRSDMGCQVYTFYVNSEYYYDSYYVGETGSKEKVLEFFERFLLVSK